MDLQVDPKLLKADGFGSWASGRGGPQNGGFIELMVLRCFF